MPYASSPLLGPRLLALLALLILTACGGSGSSDRSGGTPAGPSSLSGPGAAALPTGVRGPGNATPVPPFSTERPFLPTPGPDLEPPGTPVFGLPTSRTLGGFYRIGLPDSPLLIEVYSDFLCPDCRSFALGTQQQVIERYVRSGRARLVFRDVLSRGERSIRASEGAHCAGKQGQFWQMHNLIFQRQTELANSGSADTAALVQRLGAELLGLDQAAFGTCLAERQMLSAIQTADLQQRQRGFTAAPTFMIGTKRLDGLQTVDQIDAALRS